MTEKVVYVHKNESPYAKLSGQLLSNLHSLSCSVDHASDAMIDCVPESTRLVLGGGSLLHRIPWQCGTTMEK